MIKKYIDSLFPWRWVVLLFLITFSIPFPFLLWGGNGILVNILFWVLVDFFIGINRYTPFLRIIPSREEQYKRLLESYLVSQSDYMDLANAVNEYLKRPSADGAPIRQEMRKNLKKTVS